MERLLNGVRAIVLFGVIVLLIGWACYTENHYNMNGTVKAVNGSKIVLEDEVGEEYEIEYRSDLRVNDNVKITFDMNGTDNRQDDIVKKVVVR